MFSGVICDSSRTRVMKLFPENTNLRVVITTIAFGMGVDISDIRNVILWGLPSDFCQCWQEIGRACRDGVKGKCIIYTVPVPNGLPTAQKVKDLFKGPYESCLRRSILSEIWIKEMGQLPNTCKLNECANKCVNCTCELCLCCSYCRNQCTCYNE